MPAGMSESNKKNLITIAQHGGIRIKAIIDDASAICLGYGMDDPLVHGKILVVDMGWSKTELTMYNVKGGVLFPISRSTLTTIGGSVMVDLVVKHCIKDFKRKYKMDCSESKKSMVRLAREAELAIKAMSTGTEASIAIDSLYDGMDFNCKISRARFDDLCAIPYMQFKQGIESFLSSSEVNITDKNDITHILLGGGLTSVPKTISTIKGLFPNANIPKPGKGNASSMSTTAEAQCAGTACHARLLALEGLLEKGAPTEKQVTDMTSLPIDLSIRSECGGDIGVTNINIMSTGTPLPSKSITPMTVDAGNSQFTLVGNDSPIADVVFSTDESGECNASISVSSNGDISIEVVNSSGKVLTNLEIPSK